MNRRLAIALALAATVAASVTLAQAPGILQSLRGGFGLTEDTPAPPVQSQSKPANGFARSFSQQPPLIPHSIDGFQITTNLNSCLGCHTSPQNASMGAPGVSETHFVTRTGASLDEVSPRRWFCTQCHVPQSDAPELVPNVFKSAGEMEGTLAQ